MISIDGTWFKDEYGRSLLLRGVNLGGSSKVPFTPNGATWNRTGFYDHRQVSFVGRPFPLDQAQEHLARLKSWGLTFVRFLVPWEAVEHSGPDIYDEEYLNYLAAVIGKAAEIGISIFIDPHQDTWSRFSGGDGAPGWTFEAVGMDPAKTHISGAAILHQENGDPFPRMVWPSNAFKLASASMFTLFFAGNDFAPKTHIEGKPVQDYLQDHFIAAMQQVARRLKDLPNVVGFDSLNEPSPGWIGVRDLNQFPGSYKIGASPSPFQSILMGSGNPQEVEFWEMRPSGAKLIETRTINSEKKSLWLPWRECIWKLHGVWEVNTAGEARLIKPDYFSKVNGRPVDFGRDYLRPFINRFAAAIRKETPNAIIFVEFAPGQDPPAWGSKDAIRIVSAPHWYDGPVLFLKDFQAWLGADFFSHKIVLGSRRIRKSYQRQMERLKDAARSMMGSVPTLIGEVGIPFDMQKKKAFRSGNFKTQMRAMDRSLRAMDEALLSYTIWNYSSDNSNERGDQWNGEDLSIFSRDQQDDSRDINSGGRALDAVVRPYACATAGEPVRMQFDIRRKVFQFEFRHDPAVTASTEFFIPNFQYPDGYRVEISDGTFKCDPGSQKLTYWHSTDRELHKVVVRRR